MYVVFTVDIPQRRCEVVEENKSSLKWTITVLLILTWFYIYEEVLISMAAVCAGSVAMAVVLQCKTINTAGHCVAAHADVSNILIRSY